MALRKEALCRLEPIMLRCPFQGPSSASESDSEEDSDSDDTNTMTCTDVHENNALSTLETTMATMEAMSDGLAKGILKEQITKIQSRLEDRGCTT